MLLSCLALSALAAPEAELWATGSAGWLEYRDLWLGDPILGGFDARSSPFVADRLLLSATFETTLTFDRHHRLRIRPSTRTLQHSTVILPDGSLGAVILSDGQPLMLAVRERLLLDEASYRWRPSGHRGLSFEAGVLPFSIAGGRFLAESWPSARARLSLGPYGGPPLVADLRAALPATGGVKQAAARIGWEPSAFEGISLELAVHDDASGLPPLLLADPGMLLSVFGRVNEAFLSQNRGEVARWIDATYLDDPYGVDRFLYDAATYLDLSGGGRLWYASIFGRGQLGILSLDASSTLSFGSGTLQGSRIPPATPWGTPPEDWPISAPREPWQHDWRTLALATDLAATLRLGEGRWGERWVESFFQFASGDPDLVATSADGDAIHAFLAPDQRFLRTRVFPIDAVASSGGFSLPPGVASSGLVALGASGGVAGKRGGARLAAAVPWAWSGACVGCTDEQKPRRRYGEEIDLLGWLAPSVSSRTTLRPSAELGLFFPGPFFLDATDPERDDLGEMPIGWRLFVGIGGAIGDAP